MAVYPKAVQKPIAPGPNDPRVDVMVGTIGHVAVSMADSLYGWFSHGSGGIESHFYIRLDGTVEQYRDTAFEADANYLGNSWRVGGKRYGFISYETEGMGAGTWTPEQLAAIKELIAWANATHGCPWVKTPAWNKPGHGYHCLFPEWNHPTHACPGPQRVKQFNDEIVPWLAAEGEDDMYSDDDRTRDEATHDRVFGMLRQRYWKPNPDTPGAIIGVPANADGTSSEPGAIPAGALDTLDGNYLVGRLSRAEAKVDALTAAVQAIAKGENVAAAVEAAVNKAFDERVKDANVILGVGPQ